MPNSLRVLLVFPPPFSKATVPRLTNVSAGSSFSVTGDVNNRVITADGSSGGVGEANLTFDGSSLLVTGDARVTSNLTPLQSTSPQKEHQQSWTQMATKKYNLTPVKLILWRYFPRFQRNYAGC